MPTAQDTIEILQGLSLFADLRRPQLEFVAHRFEEEWFAPGQRILREGFAGSSFFLVVEGEALVSRGEKELSRLSRGDFFGEMSILLESPPSADVVAVSPLRCLVLPGSDLQGFLESHPTVMFRMLKVVAGRLKSNLDWLS